MTESHTDPAGAQAVALRPRLLVIGAGGHGRSLAEAVLEEGAFELIGFLDDAPSAPALLWDRPVFGTTADISRWRGLCDWVVIALGDNLRRDRLSAQAHHAASN